MCLIEMSYELLNSLSALSNRAHELEEENTLLRQHRSSSSNEVANLERLLVSIDRIRGERDELKRQLEFLETEHTFTQQQLEKERSQAQLSRSQSTDASQQIANRTAQHLKTIKRLELRVDALTSLIDHAQTQRESSEAEVSSLVDQYGHLQQEHTRVVHHMQNEIQNLRLELDQTQEELLTTRDVLSQAQRDLDDTQDSLDTIDTQRRQLNLKLYDTQGSLADGQQYISDLENQLAIAKQDLEYVTSERNSLNVHAANLAQEVEAAKNELYEAEQRYSALQAQQLANMSAEAIPKRLKAQIQELEERLARRTKEKENLVHDVKRLETNMRLQEERLSEITAELETAQMENNAMIDDCATTRESRDDALRRVEDLEVEVDALEVQIVDNEAKLRESESFAGERVNGLVVVLADAAVKSRAMINAWKVELSRREDAMADLVTSMQQVEHDKARLLESTAAAEARTAEAMVIVRGLSSEVESLREEVSERTEDLRHTTVALALSHQHQRQQQAFIQDFQNARASMRSRIQTLQHGLEDHRARLAIMTDQLTRRSEEESNVADARLSDMASSIARLEQTLAETESTLDQKAGELASRTAAHDALLSKVSELTEDNARMASTINAAASSHAEESKGIQDQLSTITVELEAMKKSHEALRRDHEIKIEDVTQTRQDLEDRQRAYGVLKAHSDGIERELSTLRSKHTQEIDTLQASLDHALERASAADTSLREAIEAREWAEQELARIQQEHEQQANDLSTGIRSSQVMKEELSNLRTQHAAQLAEANRTADDAKARVAELDKTLKEAEHMRTELQEQYSRDHLNLQTSLQELEALTATLRKEVDLKQSQIDEVVASNACWLRKVQESDDTVMRLNSEVNQLQLAQESLQASMLEK
jgi:chromosome segregation ATPase